MHLFYKEVCYEYIVIICILGYNSVLFAPLIDRLPAIPM